MELQVTAVLFYWLIAVSQRQFISLNFLNQIDCWTIQLTIAAAMPELVRSHPLHKVLLMGVIYRAQTPIVVRWHTNRFGDGLHQHSFHLHNSIGTWQLFSRSSKKLILGSMRWPGSKKRISVPSPIAPWPPYTSPAESTAKNKLGLKYIVEWAPRNQFFLTLATGHIALPKDWSW